MKNTLNLIDKYYNLANYLCLKSMYLNKFDADIKHLSPHDLKSKVSGHWGNVSQINFVYAHLNYFSKHTNKDINLIVGTGHSGLPVLINSYLDGSLNKAYKNLTINQIIENFGQHNGFRSEINPEYPNSIYDGGELGYSLSVAFGAVLQNKKIIFCLVGDGEAETGSISSAWFLNKYLNPKTDGLVIPILNLNHYKMGNSSIFSSFSHKSLTNYFKSMGYKPYFCNKNHKHMQKILKQINKDIFSYFDAKKVFPLIVLDIPKGDSAPNALGINFVDKQTSHKNPIPSVSSNNTELEYLKTWLESYNINNFDMTPSNIQNTFNNILPNNPINYYISSNDHNLETNTIIDTCYNLISKKDKLNNCLDEYFSILANKDQLFVLSPDELVSNKFKKTFSSKNKIEILNENLCQGLAQGLINTNRNCFYNAYEAFMPIVNGMFDQYCKWITECNKIEFRKQTCSLNYFLTSTCWENCYSHQNPSFIDNATNKTFDFINVLFPFDKTTKLLSAKESLLSNNQINIITSSKSINLDILNLKESELLLNKGYIYLHKDKHAKLTLIVSGDYMYLRVQDILNHIKNSNKTLNYNLIYIYNLRTLQNKDFIKSLSNTKIIYFFHGYVNTIKRLLFPVKNNVVKIYGYNDACSRGSLENKFIDNGLDIVSVSNFILGAQDD